MHAAPHSHPWKTWLSFKFSSSTSPTVRQQQLLRAPGNTERANTVLLLIILNPLQQCWQISDKIIFMLISIVTFYVYFRNKVQLNGSMPSLPHPPIYFVQLLNQCTFIRGRVTLKFWCQTKPDSYSLLWPWESFLLFESKFCSSKTDRVNAHLIRLLEVFT